MPSAVPWCQAAALAPKRRTGTRRRLAAADRSILHLYRRLLRTRRGSPALQTGGVDLLPAPDGVLAYARHCGDDRRVVVVNFATGTVEGALDGTWDVEVASDGRGEGGAFPGSVAGDAAVVLRPRLR